ncbi:MAG TPA: hypothetical protein VMW18_07385, partial [Candidatus Binatia bacterium]|nr:hypothetical protein [Candidatus Binatia bacterium]
RDKAHAEADAQHREDLARMAEQRQIAAAEQNKAMLALLEQNTRLTELTQKLSERIETLTRDVHGRLCTPEGSAGTGN